MPEKKPLVVTFTKMNGAGNDFIVLDNRFLHFTEEELATFARRFCPRRTGIGADGVLALDPPEDENSGHDFRMRYRNADGSPAGLCGNGARCLARFARSAGLGTPAASSPPDASADDREDSDATLRFASDAGPHRATVPADPSAPVRFYAAVPHGLAENVMLRTDGLAEVLPGPVSFVNTGTEHAVLFVEDADAAPVADWGPPIRRDAAFAPEGANANFVEVADAGGAESEARLVVRTFEKGVEGETQACGTGALAAAVVAWHTGRVAAPPVAVEVPGGLLRVGFRAAGGGDPSGVAIEDLYLEGPAEATFQGTVEVCF